MGNDTPSSGDPEVDRVDALLQRALEGTTTDAEHEELALYAADRPDLRAHIDTALTRRGLGEGWLARVRKDDAAARIDASRRARTERGIGVGLVLGGGALGILMPLLGGPLASVGVAVLLYSLIRVRVASHAADPYKDIAR